MKKKKQTILQLKKWIFLFLFDIFKILNRRLNQVSTIIDSILCSLGIYENNYNK